MTSSRDAKEMKIRVGSWEFRAEIQSKYKHLGVVSASVVVKAIRWHAAREKGKTGSRLNIRHYLRSGKGRGVIKGARKGHK